MKTRSIFAGFSKTLHATVEAKKRKIQSVPPEQPMGEHASRAQNLRVRIYVRSRSTLNPI